MDFVSEYDGLTPEQMDQKVLELVAVIREQMIRPVGGPGTTTISATVTNNVRARLVNLAKLYDVSLSKTTAFCILAGLTMSEEEAVRSFDAQVQETE